MLKPITDLPDRVLGFTASGEVTARDYESVLVPAVGDELSDSQSGKVCKVNTLRPCCGPTAIWAPESDPRTRVVRK